MQLLDLRFDRSDIIEQSLSKKSRDRYANDNTKGMCDGIPATIKDT